MPETRDWAIGLRILAEYKLGPPKENEKQCINFPLQECLAREKQVFNVLNVDKKGNVTIRDGHDFIKHNKNGLRKFLITRLKQDNLNYHLNLTEKEISEQAKIEFSEYQDYFNPKNWPSNFDIIEDPEIVFKRYYGS